VFFIGLLFALFLLFVMVLLITAPLKFNLDDPRPVALVPFVSRLFYFIVMVLLAIVIARRRKLLQI
jgi:hypothetical protein